MNTMDYNGFLETLTENSPQKDWPLTLKALWFEANGNWEASHDIAQEMHTDFGSWLHAYLHRKEGDEFNAGYWYRRAGKAFPKNSLAQELQEMIEYVLTGVKNQ